jgi:hypothetical protein
MPDFISIISTFYLSEGVIDDVGCGYLDVIAEGRLMASRRRSMGCLVGRTEGRFDSVGGC